MSKKCNIILLELNLEIEIQQIFIRILSIIQKINEMHLNLTL